MTHNEVFEVLEELSLPIASNTSLWVMAASLPLRFLFAQAV